MDVEGKKGGFVGIFVAMTVSLIIASLWNKVAFIKDSAHAILNPTAGVLLDWNLTWGMIIIVLAISVIMTLAQKYATDQKTLRQMKEAQKKIGEEMKKVRDNPQKMMELQKESMKFMGPMMTMGMRPMIYTAVPLILFFRWFMDYFSLVENFKFFGFFSWFWFYLISTIIFSTILRKVFDVV